MLCTGLYVLVTLSRPVSESSCRSLRKMGSKILSLPLSRQMPKWRETDSRTLMFAFGSTAMLNPMAVYAWGNGETFTLLGYVSRSLRDTGGKETDPPTR